MNDKSGPLDTSTHDEFVSYYSEQSISNEAVDRARRIRELLVSVRKEHSDEKLPDVLDIGCNAGTYSFAWVGHAASIVGIDISADLIEIAKQRASEGKIDVDFRVGSATNLPLDDSTFDICLSPELLEHVADWEKCLDEYTRVLRIGGTLYLTTTNKLCPKQQEFNLPFYSWYPGRIKRWIEKLAVTSRPELANYATYPAVNWFSYYSLRKELNARGFETMDRFDLMGLSASSNVKKLVTKLIALNSILRWFAHVCTPSTILVATKRE